MMIRDNSIWTGMAVALEAAPEGALILRSGAQLLDYRIRNSGVARGDGNWAGTAISVETPVISAIILAWRVNSHRWNGKPTPNRIDDRGFNRFQGAFEQGRTRWRGSG